MGRIALILLVFIPTIGNSQTLSGYIYDEKSGEKLIGATLYETVSSRGVTSNDFGFYSLNVKDIDSLQITIGYIGHLTKYLELPLAQDTIINIALAPIEFNLNEVKISADKPIEKRNEMGVIRIPMKQLNTLPMLAGEVDIIKTIQLLPGINSGSEGQSTIFVRGGSHDQNLLLLDDVPLYSINHLGSYVSVFNSEAINSFSVYKGAFPARYGSRLSSVIDVRMKDGNMKERKTTATAGMLTCKVQTEGYIKKDTASYMISARRFMYDLVTRPVTWLSNNKHSTGYTFYDFNAKVNYKFSDNDRIILSLYSGKDRYITKKTERELDYKETMKNSAKYGNTLAALRWNHIFNPNFFGNITGYYTRYHYKSEFLFKIKDLEENETTRYSFKSNINDFCLKSDFQLNVLPKYTIRFGTNSIAHAFTPNVTMIEQTGDSEINETENDITYHTWENSFYIENNITILKNISINVGARATSYYTQGVYFNAIEPRGLININIPKIFAIKASFSQMQQYTHMLTYSGIGLSNDLWLPITKDIAPSTSDLFSVSIAKSLFNNNFDISIEAYTKEMNNLIEYKEGVGLMDNNTENWENLVETGGNGNSKGIEFLIHKKQGRYNGWISYTLSKSTRQFDNINNGNEYPYIYDATHDISIVGNYAINKNLNLSFAWVYNTGKAMNFPNEIYYITDLEYDYNNTENERDAPTTITRKIYSSYERNSIRMKSYHRLDLGLTYTKYKKKSERIINLSIYNAYNRANPFYYYVDQSDDSDEMVIKQVSVFMFFPSVSYTWKW